jgi:predicted nucleotidyltransferase
MPKKHPSSTHTLLLSEVTGRLSQKEEVEGIILVGSAVKDALTPVSDYDLVIVLRQMPVPLHVGVTSIDGRFADLVFHTTAQVEHFLAATEPLSFADWVGRLVGWLEAGEILFDRNGLLQQAQTKAYSGVWIQDDPAGDAFHAWNGVNYNFAVARRLIAAEDPLYLQTLDLRMALYAPADLFFNYFRARNLRWDGDKWAIRYLNEHDPDYLILFRRFLIEPDRTRKFTLYEQLAVRALEPVGDLWAEGDTIIMPGTEVVTAEIEQQTLDFWESLIRSSVT